MGSSEAAEARVAAAASAGPPKTENEPGRRRRPRRIRRLELAVVLVLAVLLALSATPWPSAMVTVGWDSAGAQLASQMATLTVNPAYANLLGVEPALRKEDLAATILHCGVYDLDAMSKLNGLVEWGLKTSLWSYTGTKDWSATYAGATMSTIGFVTGDLPPTFISGGNGDGLTWLQSVPYSNRLKAAGVPVTELFWPADHTPALPHEYQFQLNFSEAKDAKDRTLDFLAAHVRPGR